MRQHEFDIIAVKGIFFIVLFIAILLLFKIAVKSFWNKHFSSKNLSQGSKYSF